MKDVTFSSRELLIVLRWLKATGRKKDADNLLAVIASQE